MINCMCKCVVLPEGSTEIWKQTRLFNHACGYFLMYAWAQNLSDSVFPLVNSTWFV